MIALGVCLSLLTPAPQAGPEARGALDAFLRRYVRFDAADLGALEAGQAVAKRLPGGEKKEIAAFGAVRVRARREDFIKRYRDVVAFRRGPRVPQIGPIGRPPRLADFAELTLDAEDVEAIRGCRPGDCDVKMSARAMERYRQEIDWSAPGARDAVQRLTREMLLEYARAYLEGGNAALAAYHDRKRPQLLAEELKAILAQSPYLFDYAPELHRHLDEFPRGRLAGAEDLLYWSKESFGLKPVVGLYHVTLYQRPVAGQEQILIASKQIYANHYFQAVLELMALVPDLDSPGFYLLELTRARIDPPRGPLAGAIMDKIAGRVKTALSEGLRNVKARMEAGAPGAREIRGGDP
jgi:hypothetical protein